jgi:hypothetical protein
MATVKIPDAVLQVLIQGAADVVSSVVKHLVEDSTKLRCDTPFTRESIEIPVGSRLRIRLIPRG